MNGVFAYHTTVALKAAVELDLFSAIAEGVDTAESLAHRMERQSAGCGSWPTS
jgi:hypothetical protein